MATEQVAMRRFCWSVIVSCACCSHTEKTKTGGPRVEGQPVQVSTSSNNNDYYCAFGLSQFAEGKPKAEKARRRESHTDSGQETLGCSGDQSPVEQWVQLESGARHLWICDL